MLATHLLLLPLLLLVAPVASFTGPKKSQLLPLAPHHGKAQRLTPHQNSSIPTWDGFLCKGDQLRWMQSVDNDKAGKILQLEIGAQSPFVEFPTVFQKWGYNVSVSEFTNLDDGYYGLQKLLKELGVSFDPRQ